MEALKRAANVNMTFVAVPGFASAVGVTPQLEAVLSGNATWSIQTYQNSREHIASGKLRALATAARKRLEAMPNLPTVAESGYPDYEVDLWDGLFAPAKTPKERVSQLADWFGAAVQVPEVRSKLAAEAFLPVGVCGTDFVALIRKQHDDYGRIIREANIKLP
jgi:tripartite-type tricarboxylate transporter receptor subunit TctC